VTTNQAVGGSNSSEQQGAVLPVAAHSVKLRFIQPGKLTRNAFLESFNGKFREYCLNLGWFASPADARSTINAWRDHYNHVRPHRSLGKKPPAVFAREAA